jgi:hypothetical protein
VHYTGAPKRAPRFESALRRPRTVQRVRTASLPGGDGRCSAPPRIWRATSGHVNQIVIAHDYTSFDAFRKERDALHDDPGNVGEVLALAVPGTATEFAGRHIYFDRIELQGISAKRLASFL